MRHARLFLAGLLVVPLPAAAEVGTPAVVRMPAPVATTVTVPAAQPMPPDHLERMIAARNLIKAGQPADASAMLRPVIVELEDAGDLVALRAAYDLAGLAAHGMGKREEAIAARTQLVLLDILGPADAPGTMNAGRAVVGAHDRNSMGRFHALANLLAAVESARRAGPGRSPPTWPVSRSSPQP